MLEFISIFIICCFVLAKSGGWAVRSLSNIARILGWREFVVASIVMAFVSSLPELFVGITSSIAGKSQLSVGNILGSNFLALTLLVGIGAIAAKGLKFEGKIVYRSRFFALIFLLLPLVLMLDKHFSRIDGVILLIALLFYLGELIHQQRRFSKVFNNLRLRDWSRLKLLLKEIGLFFVTLFLLLLSAQGIVFSATNIASDFGISLVAIGILGVAIGTSLPEIVFVLQSVRLGHKGMVLGGIVGSIVVNAGLVLGITILISPFKIQNLSLYLNSIIFSLIAVCLFLVFSKTQRTITKKEAVWLVLAYLLFFIVELFLETVS